ncbi:MAG: sodium:calcium antiporter, partial [Planctomycetota bacterium]
IRKEAVIMVAVTVGAVLLMLGGGAHRVEGAVLVAALLGFVAFAYLNGKRTADGEESSELIRAAQELDDEIGTSPSNASIARSIIFVVVGLAMLFFGSDLLVDGAKALATMLNVPAAVIGLSLVAFGTSVPELALSAIAAFRKEPDIAVGNIIGSNIFNLLCVLGFTALFSPVPLEATEGFWSRDVPAMLLLAVACLPIMLVGRNISRIEGVLLLGLYGGYLGVLFATTR